MKSPLLPHFPAPFLCRHVSFTAASTKLENAPPALLEAKLALMTFHSIRLSSLINEIYFSQGTPS